MRRLSRDTVTPPSGEPTPRLPLHTTALVILDMQALRLDRRGVFARIWGALLPAEAALYFERIESTVLPDVERLLERCRALAVPVVFTALGPAPEGGGQPVPGTPADARGPRLGVVSDATTAGAGWRIHDDLRPARGEAVLARNGGAAAPALASILQGLGVHTVVAAGVATDSVVTPTARDLVTRGFRTLIAGDACAALVQARHQAALGAFALTRGGVSTTDAILSALPRPAAGAA